MNASRMSSPGIMKLEVHFEQFNFSVAAARNTLGNKKRLFLLEVAVSIKQSASVQGTRKKKQSENTFRKNNGARFAVLVLQDCVFTYL